MLRGRSQIASGTRTHGRRICVRPVGHNRGRRIRLQPGVGRRGSEGGGNGAASHRQDRIYVLTFWSAMWVRSCQLCIRHSDNLSKKSAHRKRNRGIFLETGGVWYSRSLDVGFRCEGRGAASAYHGWWCQVLNHNAGMDSPGSALVPNAAGRNGGNLAMR
jgi:hypothetical protein